MQFGKYWANLEEKTFEGGVNDFEVVCQAETKIPTNYY